MSKNKHNNKKSNKKSKQPQASPKNRAAGIIAAVFGAIMMAGMIFALINFKDVYDHGIASTGKAPLIAALILTGVGVTGLMVSVAMSIKMLVEYDRELSKAREGFSVDPSVLRDERIREFPEVKKLMKHAMVKRIFDEEKIEAADLSDPHVQQLIDALLAHADENGVIRF